MTRETKIRLYIIFLGSLVLTAIIVALIWFFYWQFIVYTEDAYVQGNEVMITPQVAGGVAAIYADDTDYVEKGQLLVELDCLPLGLQLEEKKASLAEVVRNVRELFADVLAKEALVFLRQAELRQKMLDFEHRIPLVDSGAISLEEFEQSQTDVDTARAQLNFAQQELQIAYIQVQNTTVQTHPLVLEAVAQVKDAFLNKIRCQIFSPVNGYIAKRTTQVGDRVAIGDILMWVVPLDEIWLNANFKETKLRNVRTGQPVTFTTDIYGRFVKFHGKVVGFQPGTGNAFSILPPENASGNWIKIIQRVPVRVNFDKEELKRYPLFLGLSLRVKVHIRDRSLKKLTQIVREKAIYTTTIYETQQERLQEFQDLVCQIIESNN